MADLFAPGSLGAPGGPGGLSSRQSVAERLTEEFDWSTYQVATGPATSLGAALRGLLSSGNVDEASAAWEQIEEQVFSQCIIYSAAEPTVSVMLAALMDDQPPWRSGRILNLLFFILKGASATDPSLQGRCRHRAHEGLWLLARWAVIHDGWERQNALDVIDVVASDRSEFIRTVIGEPKLPPPDGRDPQHPRA